MTQPKLPLIYIIVLNWNNAADTIECLNSLREIKYVNKRVVVVDNGSTDGSREKIKGWISSAGPGAPFFLLENSRNLGFTGGNNAGIDYALQNNTEYILLLNNDTLVPEDLLGRLVDSAWDIPRLGILGCKIRHYPAEDRIWFSGGYINSLKGCAYHFTDDCQEQRQCDFITGCLMFIPCPVLKEVGAFDDRYFLISEDTDLSRRVLQKGYQLVVDGRIVIFHKISSTIGGCYSPRHQYYFHRNRMLFFSKFLSSFSKFFFFSFQFLVVIPFWAFIELIKGNKRIIRWALLGYRDFICGRFGPCPYF